TGDAETPVSAYAKVCSEERTAYLFESAERFQGIGRYSVVAWDPLACISLSHNGVEIVTPRGSSMRAAHTFFDEARKLMGEIRVIGLPEFPVVGSLAGFVGYDAVRLIEKLKKPLPSGCPVAHVCYFSRFVVFDHFSGTITLCAAAESHAKCIAKIDAIEKALSCSPALQIGNGSLSVRYPPKDRFLTAVHRAKEHIEAGDIFQVVLSDQIQGETKTHALLIYQWMKRLNPSPYMFFLRHGDLQLVGASPETLVKVENGKVVIKPIAGTSGRSTDPVEDNRLENELRASAKERAEHIMLVDLARNDASKVCEYGSIEVHPYMAVERFSHVMHIVSRVTGRLRADADVWDAFMAAFPAGTVSGAPKVRAMEIIDDLEPDYRGPYGGAVGYWGPGPTMDTCIAIRMIRFHGNQFIVQAGAGIVADSSPESEYEEIMKKSAHAIASLSAGSGGMA
ncbi:MAG: anthranilate synthase component I family protein, partial [Desulfomonilaceae bacterium]